MYPLHSEQIVKDIQGENLRRAERSRLVKLAQGTCSRNIVFRTVDRFGVWIAPLVRGRSGDDATRMMQSGACAEC